MTLSNKNTNTKIKVKGKQKGNAKVWLESAAAALIAALALFAVMLQIEKNTLAGYEKGDVYIALADIPKGQTITEDNIGNYMLLKSIEKDIIPQNAVTDMAGIIGQTAAHEIEAGVLLTSGMFETYDSALSGMDNPVIAGIKADDLYQFTGGVLRAGDRIHIYNAEDDGNVKLKWSNVYVQQVFDSSGKVISAGDTENSAQRINIYMDKSDIEEFYTDIKSGSLRVVKLCE